MQQETKKLQKKKIVIAKLPLSLNKYLRMHWAQRKKRLDEWVKEINLEWLKDGKIKFKAPVRVTIHYFFGDNRKRDFDNYSGKLILDAIKGRYIEDDSTDYIRELILRADFRDDFPRTEITIEELDINTFNC